MASSEFVSVTTMPPNKQLQYNMIQMHTLLKLGYQNIMKHLDNPPHDDLDNFLGYCEAWAATIDNHHDSEGVHSQPIMLEYQLKRIVEQLVFPFLNQKLDFSHEKAQHAVIHAGLDALAADLRAAKADTSKFDPDALKASMIALREPLVGFSRGSLVQPC
jgi:hypothetical protein